MNATSRRWTDTNSETSRRRYIPEAKTASGVRRHRPDYWIFVLVSLLLTLGLVVVYSISPGLAASQHVSQSYFILKQLIDGALAFIAFWLAASIPLKAWSRTANWLALAAIAASLIVIAMPVDPMYPAHRWLRLGSFSFQVVELFKLSIVVWLAKFLSQRWKEGALQNSKLTLQPLLLVLLGVGLVVAKLQSDLGSAGVILIIATAMAYTVGIPLKRIGMIGAVVLALAVLAISTSSYRRERLSTYLHPGTNCEAAGYQECQVLISVGSGGLFGLGLGHSVQAYGYTPEASNDSIFSIMAEEFGFIGSSLIIAIYVLLISRIKRVIEHTADQFSRLIAVGTLAWLSTQIIINVGAMIGLLPLKGITLPLISQGGTSLVFLTAALGIVFHISRYTSYNVAEPSSTEAGTVDSFDRRRHGRAYNSDFVSRPRA